MKYLLLAILLLASASVSAKPSQYIPPTEFRGIAWGSEVQSLGTNTIPTEETGDTKCYVRRNEKLEIGDAAISKISYCYYQNKLFFIIVNFKDFHNFGLIKDTLFQKYGPGNQGNRYIDDYFWGVGTSVTINFEYKKILDRGQIGFIYNPIFLQREKDQKERNKKAVGDI